jgi:hypothetical protein
MISLANAIALDVRDNRLALSQVQGKVQGQVKGKLALFRFMLRPALCRGRAVAGQ